MMFSQNSGAHSSSETNTQQANQSISPGITMAADGILRWTYEMNMLKNPMLILTIRKMLLIAAIVPALLVFFLSLGDGFGSALMLFFKIMGIVVSIVTGLLLLAYPLVALINGGVYCVIFEMDDHTIRHIQMQKQFKKAQILAMIAALAGTAAGNPQAAAAGILAGSKQSSLSCFEKVKSITVNKNRHVLYVNEILAHNQIYADARDFDFVSEYIISRCKKAKVTTKQ